MTHKPRDPLLLEVAAAIGAGNLRLAPLPSTRDEFVHGLCEEGGRVTIDPAPSTVDTAVHELLHRLRPTWTERGVRRRTRQLMASLSDAEVEKLYELVLVAGRKVAGD